MGIRPRFRPAIECAHLPEGIIPSIVTQLAVLAVEIHDVFLAGDDADSTPAFTPPLRPVEAAITLARAVEP